MKFIVTTFALSILLSCAPPMGGNSNNGGGGNGSGTNQCSPTDCNQFCVNDGMISGSCEQSSDTCICSDRCTFDSQCGISEMCIDNDCESALNRDWVITIVGGTIPERRQSGETWDALGGAPDPYVVVTVDGERCVTATKNDTFSPRWNEECTFTVFDDSTLQVKMGDEDALEHDLIANSNTEALTVAQLRNGQIVYAWDGIPDPVLTLNLRLR